MAAAVVFKVRCPSCGKSLRVESGDAGGQVICRACGVRVQVPAAPLLGPVSADPAAIPVLPALSAATLSSLTFQPPPSAEPAVSQPLAATPEPDGRVAETTVPTPMAGGQTPTPVAPTPTPPPTRPGPGQASSEITPPALPAWALESSVPAATPPPMRLLPPLGNIAVSSGRVSASPARQIPAWPEQADPDQTGLRPNQAPSLAAADAAAPTTSGFDPLADTAVHPALTGDEEDGDGSPSDQDVRAILAAQREGRIRLVDHRQRHGHPVWWTLLGMLSAAALVLIALAATGQIDWFDPWEKQATPTITQIKAEGDAFAVRGALKEAHERYQKVDELVAGRPIRDPNLRAIVEAARADGRSIYVLLLGRMTNANAAPIPPPAAPGSTPPAAPPAPAPATAPVDLPPVAVHTPPRRPASVSPGPTTSPAESTPEAKVEPIAQVEPITPEIPNVPPEAAAPRPPRLRVRRTRPALRPVVADDDGPITDAEIGKSIEAGVNHLLKQFDSKTHVLADRDRRSDNAYFCGMNALAVYALLQAGQAIDDPRVSHRGAAMKAKLEALRNLPIEGSHQTYARGLRATALALFNRGEDFKVMANDVDWLLGTTDGGAYTYNGDYRTIGQRGLFPSRKGSWDNSNSQYGLLGVWSGIEADPRIEVPLAYWKAVDRHWTDCQSPDGQWGYGEGGTGGRLTMTCAGIASLFVAHEYLEPPTSTGQVGREPFSPALRKGLAWFERGNNSVNVRGGNWWGYALYGIERVGLASGFKHFGSHDWYRELSEQIVGRQLGSGAWGDGVVDTSYALLFLSRGRHPILMNKLRFDGYWSNRPRDISNLARFAGRQFERPINWQVVNIQNPWTDWTDSPILYIASHEPLPLTDEHIGKLRSFVRSGGMIFTHADAGAPAFDKWARELAAKLFTYEMTELPENHPLWTSVYKLTARPPLWGVSNGSRLLMVHSPTDIALRWQQRTDRAFESRPDATKPAAAAGPDSDTKTRMLSPFQFGLNLFVYAAGKRDFRNRLDSAWIEPPQSAPLDTIRIARLQYGGNWDPEPGAWERYANWFHRSTGTRLDVQAVKVSELKGESALTYPFAHLTGTARVGFSDAEAAALRAYVDGGGVVLIDPTGGMNGFDTEVRESLLSRTLPDRYPLLLDPDHPLMSRSAPGMEDVGKTMVRGYTLERLGGGIGTLQMVTPKWADSAEGDVGSGAIIVTSLDLTSGLLGANVWGILGFESNYAQRLVRNAIFWSVDGRRQPPGATSN